MYQSIELYKAEIGIKHQSVPRILLPVLLCRRRFSFTCLFTTYLPTFSTHTLILRERALFNFQIPPYSEYEGLDGN